jgi:hypothetical protein
MSRAGAALFAMFIFPLLAAPVARAQSEPALWRFASPDSSAVLGIDWARIRESPAGAMIREKIMGAGGSRGPLAAFPGLGLLDSVDHILISSSARASSSDSDDDSSGGARAEPEESKMLVAFQGRFDAQRVRELFARSARPQSYNAFQVYRPQGKQKRNMAYVLFDPQTILYGDAPSVFAALDRNQFPDSPRLAAAAPGPGTMATRAAQLDAKYELWAILDIHELLASDTVAAFLDGNRWTSAAQGIEAGLSLRNGLDADFIVHFSSDAVAKRVVADLGHAVNSALKDRAVDAQTQDLARKLKFNVDGSTTKISVRLSQQELEETAQAFIDGEKAGSVLAESAPAANRATTAPVPAGPPSKPGVIRIEGLDDGPREIPVGGPDH